jgi:hypothetical protein
MKKISESYKNEIIRVTRDSHKTWTKIPTQFGLDEDSLNKFIMETSDLSSMLYNYMSDEEKDDIQRVKKLCLGYEKFIPIPKDFLKMARWQLVRKHLLAVESRIFAKEEARPGY